MKQESPDAGDTRPEEDTERPGQWWDALIAAEAAEGAADEGEPPEEAKP
ncbi:MAG: hypothetical protein H0V85_08275 [Thermoleophilaceae bacterium]|nr:hypothetical protein [Thermoleophilaceae bacterium]